MKPLDPTKRQPALAVLHDLEHDRGMCGCDDPPPPAVESDQEYTARMAQLGRDELARMREHGLPVDLDRVENVDLAALGESVREARLNEKLDRILAEREAMYTIPSTGCPGCDLGGARHHPCTRPDLSGQSYGSPDPSNPPRPSSERSFSADGVDQGRGGSASRSSRRRRVRNAKKSPLDRFLSEAADDEQFGDD